MIKPCGLAVSRHYLFVVYVFLYAPGTRTVSVIICHNTSSDGPLLKRRPPENHHFRFALVRIVYERAS
jgi:hypothetical protein